MISFNDSNSNVREGGARLSDSSIDVSKAVLELEWEKFSSSHICPSRMLKLAAGIEQMNDDEHAHFQVCDSCSKVLSGYLNQLGPNTDDIHENRRAKDTVALDGEVFGAESILNAMRWCMSNISEVVFSDSKDIMFGDVPQLLKDHLLVDGPVVFPDEHVVQASWQFGLVSRYRESDPEVADQLIDLIANSTLKKFNNEFEQENLVIVCFGREMHAVGVRIGAILIENGHDSHHVVLAHDFYEPKLVCDPREPVDAPLIVLVDVVHSGGLLNRTIDTCQKYGPASVLGVTVIDKSGSPPLGKNWASVWEEDESPGISLESFLSENSVETVHQLKRFEPNTHTATSRDCVAREHVLSPLSDKNPIEVEPKLREFIHETGALREDHVICGKRYPYVVNTLDLLNKSSESREFILKRSAELLEDIDGRNACFAYHKSRSQRAGKYGKLLGERLDWPVIGYGSRSNSEPVAPKQIKELARFDHVVFVDSAVRTGDSLVATRQAIDDSWFVKHTQMHALFVFDALTQSSVSSLSKSTGIDVRTVFKIPMAPPTEQVRDWANKRKRVLGERLSSNDEFTHIAEALGKYLSPRGFSKREEPSLKEVETQLDKVVKDGQFPVVGTERITNACMNGTAHEIRHLSVDEVVQDSMVQNLLVGVMHNSMKPSFKEHAAYALAAANNFEWMTLDWLLVNRPFLTSPTECWKSIVMIECEMKMQNMNGRLDQFRESISEYREMPDVFRQRQGLLPGMEKFANKSAKSKKDDRECKRLNDRLDLMMEAAE